MKTVETYNYLERVPAVYILSGEGEEGTWEKYNGKRTERAIMSRLKKEQCNGDRWARAYYVESRYENGLCLYNIFGDDCIDVDADFCE